MSILSFTFLIKDNCLKYYSNYSLHLLNLHIHSSFLLQSILIFQELPWTSQQLLSVLFPSALGPCLRLESTLLWILNFLLLQKHRDLFLVTCISFLISLLEFIDIEFLIRFALVDILGIGDWTSVIGSSYCTSTIQVASTTFVAQKGLRKLRLYLLVVLIVVSRKVVISQTILNLIVNHTSIINKTSTSWVVDTSMTSLKGVLRLWSLDWVKTRSHIVTCWKAFIFNVISWWKFTWLDVIDVLLRGRLLVVVADSPQDRTAQGIHAYRLEELSLLSLSNHLLVLEVVKVFFQNALISVRQFTLKVLIFKGLLLTFRILDFMVDLILNIFGLIRHSHLFAKFGRLAVHV